MVSAVGSAVGGAGEVFRFCSFSTWRKQEEEGKHQVLESHSWSQRSRLILKWKELKVRPDPFRTRWAPGDHHHRPDQYSSCSHGAASGTRSPRQRKPHAKSTLLQLVVQDRTTPTFEQFSVKTDLAEADVVDFDTRHYPTQTKVNWHWWYRTFSCCCYSFRDWAFRFIPLLTGKARSAYVHMDIDDALDYDDIIIKGSSKKIWQIQKPR